MERYRFAVTFIESETSRKNNAEDGVGFKVDAAELSSLSPRMQAKVVCSPDGFVTSTKKLAKLSFVKTRRLAIDSDEKNDPQGETVQDTTG